MTSVFNLSFQVSCESVNLPDTEPTLMPDKALHAEDNVLESDEPEHETAVNENQLQSPESNSSVPVPVSEPVSLTLKCNHVRYVIEIVWIYS